MAESGEKQGFRQAREHMLKQDIRPRGIDDTKVLAAMRNVPREAFVSDAQQGLAYADHPLPIDSGQTISQPYIVALMTQSLRLEATDTVLEVGTGSGYAAAVLSQVCKQVYSIECIAELAEKAKQRLETLGYRNIEVIAGDGSLGWPEAAPYNAITVTAGGPDVPAALKDQLAVGGRLVMPVGGLYDQVLYRVTRLNDHEYETENLGAVRFVPLTGVGGW